MHIHDAARILELGAPPYEVGRIRAARRRLAKQWHPDKAPPTQRVVHQNHMVSVNRAADLLAERAEEAGGSIGASHVAAARQAARDEQRAAGERAAARAETGAPRGGRRRTTAPERSVVHSYARSESHPEWGVGRVVGVFVTGGGEEVRRWAEVSFAGQPIRTLRYENLRFVDFSRPDPGTDRARRFLAAARRAAGQGDHPLAVRRLLHARTADPRNVAVLKLLALEQRAAGDPAAAIRTCADWGRVAPRDPQPHRLTQTLYAQIGAAELAADAGRRAEEREGRDELAPRRSRRRRRRRRARAA
jgi:hypothetical protein